MATYEVVKLYRSPDHPGLWIGQDKLGGLVQWPAEPKGWTKRTPFKGSRRGLEVAEPALARGTGWPGTSGGQRPRAPSGKPGRNRTIRATDDDWETWREIAEAEGRSVSEWACRELSAAAKRAKK
jgi:hypothetical protein